MGLENDQQDIGTAWNIFMATLKKENFFQNLFIGMFCLMFLNWFVCIFIGWSQNPQLTQMQVLMNSLEFFTWNFELIPKN